MAEGPTASATKAGFLRCIKDERREAIPYRAAPSALSARLPDCPARATNPASGGAFLRSALSQVLGPDLSSPQFQRLASDECAPRNGIATNEPRQLKTQARNVSSD
jgi:hypothetical protein